MTRDALISAFERLAKQHGFKLDRMTHNGRTIFDLQRPAVPSTKPMFPDESGHWEQWQRLPALADDDAGKGRE